MLAMMLPGSLKDHHTDHLVPLCAGRAIFLEPDWTKEYEKFFKRH
jgi:hypothetical protein